MTQPSPVSPTAFQFCSSGSKHSLQGLLRDKPYPNHSTPWTHLTLSQSQVANLPLYSQIMPTHPQPVDGHSSSYGFRVWVFSGEVDSVGSHYFILIAQGFTTLPFPAVGEHNASSIWEMSRYIWTLRRTFSSRLMILCPSSGIRIFQVHPKAGREEDILGSWELWHSALF